MFDIDLIIRSLRKIPKAIVENNSPVSKHDPISITLDGSEHTVAVYNDNFIEDRDRWEDKKERLERQVKGSHNPNENDGRGIGIDALAWYVSFHFNQTHWGIYIPLSSINFMNETLQIKGYSHSKLDQLAKEFFLYHERYHFAFDIFVTQLEFLCHKPIYRQTLARFKNTPPLKGVGSSFPYNPTEENLANTYMLRKIKESGISKSLFKKVEEFVSGMPVGYCDAIETFHSGHIDKLKKENINNYLSLPAVIHELNILDNALDLSPLIPEDDEDKLKRCPIHIIDDTKSSGLDPDIIRFFRRLEKIEESKKFKRMLKKQPDIIQNDWQKKKKSLTISLPKPSNFKRFKSFFYLKLIQGFRVHFIPPKRGDVVWIAEEINDHKGAGHG